MRPLKIGRSYDVVFDPAGACCLTFGRDVSLWDLSARKKAWTSHPLKHPSHAAFTPDGTGCVVKSTSGRMVLLDSGSGKLLRDYENESMGEGCAPVVSPCGGFLVDASWDGVLTARRADSGEVVFSRAWPGEMITGVHAAAGGLAWVTIHTPKQTNGVETRPPAYGLRWGWPFDAADPERLRVEWPRVWSTALSPCGAKLAVVSGQPPSELAVIPIGGGEPAWSRTVAIGGSGDAVRWSPCGRLLGSVQDGCVVVYRAEDGEPLLVSPLEYPCSVAFDGTGAHAAFGSWQQGVVFDLDLAAAE
ncbi:MAG: WD40 repeat domain-containing protein [Planctomycetota bacterium]